MDAMRFVVMGAGEVGLYLAETLSGEGHDVTMIDSDPAKQRLVEDRLDVGFVLGNGSHVPVLDMAEVASCDLFIAASSSDEANLAASLLAKGAGAPRTVVRVKTAEDVTNYGNTYETAFRADLLISTQLLATTRILNHALGFNTLDVAYLGGGALQIRRTSVEAGSVLHRKPLAEAGLPRDCLVLAFIAPGRLVVPTGADKAEPGDDALIFAATGVIDEAERRISGHARRLGLVVVAGGGATAETVVAQLEPQVKRIKIIEADRGRAEELAVRFPRCEIVHGDATDGSILRSEGVADAQHFIALTGNDEKNLMACLLAQELGARKMTALVQKSDTSSLWRKVALMDVVSPRTIAAERIRSYIDGGFKTETVSYENGAAAFIHRSVEPQSVVAGAELADVEIPQGLIVAAVLKGGAPRIPRASYTFEVGDDVILFVRREEMGMAQILFPGRGAA